MVRYKNLYKIEQKQPLIDISDFSTYTKLSTNVHWSATKISEPRIKFKKTYYI